MLLRATMPSLHLHVLPFLLLLLLLPLAATQVVQDDWKFPQLPDYSWELQLNKDYTLQWTSNLQNWFPYFCESCNVTQLDLWVASPDNSAKHKIASNVDVTKTLTMEWTAIVPSSELSDAPSWSFKFVPFDTVPDTEQISSPQFNLTGGTSSSSTTSSSSSTSAPTSTSSSSSTDAATATSSTNGNTDPSSTPAPSPTNTPSLPPTSNSDNNNNDNSTSTLTPGAKAGIGIGAAIGGIALIALGWFLARRRPSSSSPGQGSGPPPAELPPPSSQHPQSMSHMQTYYNAGNDYSRESSPWDVAAAANNKPVHEMMHEMHGTPAPPPSSVTPSSLPQTHRSYGS
ncbi:hypothetical protein F4808DRAFT_442831 [Astrocystis sublimbata]|nr:hypothetical protein F4808DRAFT_442831 [Astrocystis sublimbata]